ncbi:hypothetical protein LUZ61_006370 [Rhynchospora tenuis]|uniref:F-box domain-containing protein n=1 Tax=Rhynchospora tenuis TaxID=198213 RepID=A0AAD5ZRF7_9POAL|nr:hypothetical protein LUZ61_006370 [Rhynchospora tenuis]
MEDPSPFAHLIPYLPDEISVQIIARIPHSYHRTLCHVSRSWRSLLLGRLLLTLRSSLHCTEPTLCLSIRTQTYQSLWLVLTRGHSYSKPLPSPPLATVGSACTTVGPFVFVLGGCLSDDLSNVVQILDLRIGGQWFLGPCMSIARECAAASFLNGRIYAIGGCLPSSEAWAESLNLFDKNPQWVPIDSPVDLRSEFMSECVVFSSKILARAMGYSDAVAYDPSVVPYDPVQNTGSCSAWVSAPTGLDIGWNGSSVVVNGILYTYDSMREIKWYNAGTDKWRPLMGIDKDLPKFLNFARLVNFNGVLCVIWPQQTFGNKRKEMMVNWVGIGVTDLGSEGLHGSILWCETVALNMPYDSAIEHCVVAEF